MLFHVAPLLYSVLPILLALCLAGDSTSLLHSNTSSYSVQISHNNSSFIFWHSAARHRRVNVIRLSWSLRTPTHLVHFHYDFKVQENGTGWEYFSPLRILPVTAVFQHPLQNLITKPVVVIHAFQLDTWEAMAGRCCQVQGQSGLLSKIMTSLGYRVKPFLQPPLN